MKDISQFKSTRYFQLIPDILVEYNYYDVVSVRDQTGDVDYRIKDFGPDDNEHKGYVVHNKICNTRTFGYIETSKDKEDHIYYKEENFVLPINKSESKFIQCVNGDSKLWVWNKSDFACEKISGDELIGTNEDPDDIACDTFRLHFTSRNYLGNNQYDGFIISAFVYDKYKNKVCLLSQYVRKTDDPTIEEDPVLINQKLYTTYMDFFIPNPQVLLKSNETYQAVGGEKKLRELLFPKYDILDNSPLVMSIYGVKSTYTDNTHEYYNVEKLNSIYIPILDSSNNLSIEIDEAEDGDYFDIYPTVDDEVVSFSDYIYNISDGRPEIYIVFYELTLTECHTSELNGVKEVTHREQFIVNGARQRDEDNYALNEEELDRHIYYRPVIRNASDLACFIIDVKTYIINTLDNTTTVRQSSVQYGLESVDSNIKFIKKSPNKYGKKMNKIYLGEIPAQINVYNKKPDLDRDGLKLTNASSNVKIENHQHSIIGFIECANVGVSIEQVPIEQIQQQ